MRWALRTVVLSLLLAAIVALPRPAVARDNSLRVVGVGFQDHFAGPIAPSTLLSAKFAAAPTAEFAALFGLAVEEDYISVAFGGKALLILVPEEHLNVYVAVSVIPSVGTFGLHAFGYSAGPGIAFYPPGAENLELFAEFGLAGATRFVQTSTRPAGVGPVLGTQGSALLGLHYWF
ncbi:MAG: hypothetical protein D6729_07840 [Deltaproteobacteria bacterium]|nr:MAG: hypothetical protein D6729_07840 [Deltaproteobacteria bacterium]